jgi:hypothetical protein
MFEWLGHGRSPAYVLGRLERHNPLFRILEEGSVIATGHSGQRMRQRHFDIQDIMYTLEHGSVNGLPEWNETYRE